MKSISKENIDNTYLIVDVRTKTQYNDGHLHNAINLPIVDEKTHEKIYEIYQQKGSKGVFFEIITHHLIDSKNFFVNIYRLCSGKKVVFYCSRARFRSKLVYVISKCMFIDSYILEGGIKGCSEKEYEALCFKCGAEHEFNDMEINGEYVHCKKCSSEIPVYKI